MLPDMCSNCNNKVGHEATAPPIKFDDVEIGEVKIWDIIVYVYRIGRISLDEFKLQFKNTHQECESINTFEEGSLEMCDLCLSLLSDSYKALKQFEDLSHQASFIQKVQTTCKKWEDFPKIETAVIPSSSSLISSFRDKTGNEDLFDSFNFDDVGHPHDEPEERFTDEYKYEALDDVTENVLSRAHLQSSASMVDLIPEKTGEKFSLEKMPKQLFVKIERMSEEDVEYYNNKKSAKSKISSKVMEHKIVQKFEEIGKKMMLEQNDANKSSDPRLLRVKKVTCKLCGKGLGSLKYYRKHMKMVHKQASEEFLKNLYKKCEICGLTLHRNGLKSHMQRHGPREAFKCNTCGKAYKTKHGYRDHLLTHSENFTPYLCRHCGMTFNDERTLRSHEKRHNETKKFSCAICSKKFFSNADLERHMTTHSEERKFICDECGVGFKLNKALETHKRKHKFIAENGEYSSKCEYCERLFKHSESLKMHMQIHEKRFKCSFCGKVVSSKTHLKRHENLHRNNPAYQPRKYKTWKSDVRNQPIPPVNVTSVAAYPSMENSTCLHGNESDLMVAQ